MEEQITIDQLLRNTWLKMAKMYNDKCAKYNSTMVIGFALLSIDPKNGTPSTQLGPKMGIEPTSLSRTLKKLDELKYITKKPNPNDGRSVLICLTTKGKSMRDLTKSEVLNFNEKILESITQDELDTFIKVTKTIRHLTSMEKLND